LIKLTNKKINNCHTHFTHFAKPKWQTILEQLSNFRKKLLFLLTKNSLGNIKSKYKRHSLITATKMTGFNLELGIGAGIRKKIE